MPGGVCGWQQCYNKAEDQKRSTVFCGEVFETGPWRKCRRRPNQKRAITSQMALTLHGFEQDLQLI